MSHVSSTFASRYLAGQRGGPAQEQDGHLVELDGHQQQLVGQDVSQLGLLTAALQHALAVHLPLKLCQFLPLQLIQPAQQQVGSMSS